MNVDPSKYIITYDNAPPTGDRCALCIALSREQYDATLRANVPPGDADGEQILRDLDELQTAFKRQYPDAVCGVVVIDTPLRSAQSPAASPQGPAPTGVCS